MALTRAGHVLSWGSGQQGVLGRVGPRMRERDRLATLLAPGEVPFKRRRGVAHRCAASAVYFREALCPFVGQTSQVNLHVLLYRSAHSLLHLLRIPGFKGSLRCHQQIMCAMVRERQYHDAPERSL